MKKSSVMCILFIVIAFFSGGAYADCTVGHPSVTGRITKIFFNPWEGFPIIHTSDPSQNTPPGKETWVRLHTDYKVNTPEGRAMLSIALAAYANNSLVKLSCKDSGVANIITIMQE